MEPLPDWWPFPPSTGPTIPWPDDEATRNAALSLGQQHNEALRALQRLSADNGGGLMGLIKGMLSEYERRRMITGSDKSRILAIFAAFRAIAIGDTDRTTGFQRITALHAEAVADPTAKPFALAVSSVTASYVAMAATDDRFTTGLVTGVADGFGIIYGGFGGPLTSIAIGIAASEIVLHTHVSWS